MSTDQVGVGRLRWLICVVIVLLSGVFRAADAAPPGTPRFVFISHAPDSDKWWNVIRNALKHASEDFSVEVD